MKRTALLVAASTSLFVTFVATVKAQTGLTAQEAHAIGVDAYLYFYPLISMDVTRKVFTNVEPGKEPGRGPMNTVQSLGAYPPANDKGVVRYNFDT
jgi:hypothetical protein